MKLKIKSLHKRIHLLDEIRGFCVFCMVFYHAFYTMAFMFSMPMGSSLIRFFMPLEPFFAGVFVFISGVSSNLSRSNLKRGLKLLVIALAITIITYFFIPNEVIFFGILHMLSFCMIFFGVTKPLLNKINILLGLVLCLILFLLTMSMPQHLYIGIEPLFRVDIPSSVYNLKFLFWLGIPSSGFYSADYFPLFPWISVFLAGTFTGNFLLKTGFPKFSYRSRAPFFSLIGKHALIIYIIHQPVIYCILWVANKLIMTIHT